MLRDFVIAMGVLQVGKEDEKEAILYAEVFGKLIKPKLAHCPH